MKIPQIFTAQGKPSDAKAITEVMVCSIHYDVMKIQYVAGSDRTVLLKRWPCHSQNVLLTEEPCPIQCCEDNSWDLSVSGVACYIGLNLDAYMSRGSDMGV